MFIRSGNAHRGEGLPLSRFLDLCCRLPPGNVVRVALFMTVYIAACLAIYLAMFAGGSAHAQLRGLGGSGIGGSGIGGIGSVSPGVGSGPRSPDIPLGGTTTDIQRTLPAPNSSTIDGITGRTIDSASRGVVDPLEQQLRNTVGNPANLAAPRPATGPRASRVPPPGEQRFVSTEVLVGLPSNLSPQALDALAQRHRLTRIDQQSIGLTGTTFHRWQITDQRSVPDVIRALEADRGVTISQPNYRFTLQQNQRGNTVDQYTVAKLQLPEAHRLATGGRILVAVIDNGIDTSHPEFAGLIATRFDAFENPEPPAAHGTGMAGAIVANARLTGVAPAARILDVRAFTAAGGDTEGTTISILKGIDWAVAKGARIINMSFAGPHDPEISRSLAAASKKGVILIAAAGNGGPKSGPLYPAADPNVIAVAATDSDDRLFSNSTRGRHIAIAAPGVDIIVPALSKTYQVTTGTSVAAAHVSGIVALLLELNPRLTPQAVRKILLETAKDLGPKGRDDQFGAGLVDAYRALQSINSANARGPVANATAAR